MEIPRITLIDDHGPICAFYRTETTKRAFDDHVKHLQEGFPDQSRRDVSVMDDDGDAWSLAIARKELGMLRASGSFPWIPKQALTGIRTSSQLWIVLHHDGF